MVQFILHCGQFPHCGCNRYAMKRKVAGGLPGNFRRVCPILNRATVITEYGMCFMLLAKGRLIRLGLFLHKEILIVVLCRPKNHVSFSAFFNRLTRNTRYSVNLQKSFYTLLKAFSPHSKFLGGDLSGSQSKNQN